MRKRPDQPFASREADTAAFGRGQVGLLLSVAFGDDDLASVLRRRADVPQRAPHAAGTDVHVVLGTALAHHLDVLVRIGG